jgi:hypothetical protein
MPTCQCGAKLPGRRRKCDACKTRPGTSASSTAPAPTEEPSTPVPSGLKDRGRELWVSLNLTLDSPAGQTALEACRLADRLDEFDRVIAGKGVLNLMAFRLHLNEVFENDERQINVEVSFQNVLAEARQQQNTFRLLLHEIASAVSPAARPAPTKTEPTKATKKNPLDELKERREARGK